jgi:hypothetical protein
MLNDNTFYHGHVRNVIVAFGSLFSNIRFQRKNTEGEVEQTIHVPIAYSQKEKWVHSIEANPDGNRGIYAALPRMGFEITGYSYDSARKLARMNQIHCLTEDGREQLYTPVPYNIDITLYFATKTTEDGLQILEQILPTFSPEYTLSVKAIPELNLVQDVPFILNSVSVQDDYEGDLETRRFVIHTLNFTAKVNFFGGLSNVGVIKQVEANVAVSDPQVNVRLFVAEQETPTSVINENWLDNF